MFLRYVALALTLFPGLPSGQQSIPPPPKPADSGPSLAETLQFVEQRLNSIGPVNYALYYHNNADGKELIIQKGIEISRVKATPGSCLIDYHFNGSKDGKVVATAEGNVSFKDVEDIVVLSVEQITKEANSKAGMTTWEVRADPSTFVLRARHKNGFANEFYFSDEGVANRVAKAMVHAVELCGGGNRDPF
jgi:hypothetical protein